MMKSLLVASDLAHLAKPAVHPAVQLAQRAGAAPSVLHVVEDDLLEDRMRQKIRSAEDYLTEQVAGLGRLQAGVLVARGHAVHILAVPPRA